jgi:hypothetical protein
MSNREQPADDKEQPTTAPADYRVLLAVTRPLVIAEHSLPSWRGGEICRSGFGIWPEQVDRRAQSVLRRGEILRSGNSGPGIKRARNAEAGTSSGSEVGDSTAQSKSALPQTDSNLQIRIYLGMS